jgi:hypothetical protein
MLLEELIRLETELHKHQTRCNRQRMEQLLHPQFMEFGRFGERYSREEVLNEFRVGEILPPIHAENFEVMELAEGVALLTYVSAHVNYEGKLHRHSVRSSIWIKTDAGWQMRFHQGTPTDAANQPNDSFPRAIRSN